MDTNVCGDITVEDQFGVPDPVRKDSVRQSCSTCESHFLKILEVMEMERSLAADREKRLNSKIDDLTRLVSSLKEVVMESGSPAYSMAAAKAVGHDETKSKGKPRRARSSFKAGEQVQAESAKSVRSTNAPTSQDSRAQPDLEASAATSTCEDVDSVHEPRTQRSDLGLDDPGARAEGHLKPSAAQKIVDRLKKFEDMQDDVEASWRLVTNTKPTQKKSVFFVGNLLPEMQSEQLKLFIERRAADIDHPVSVFEVKIFPKESSSSARITINASSAKLVNSRRFWPAPLYSRCWNFDKYRSETEDSHSSMNSAQDDQHSLP